MISFTHKNKKYFIYINSSYINLNNFQQDFRSMNSVLRIIWIQVLCGSLIR